MPKSDLYLAAEKLYFENRDIFAEMDLRQRKHLLFVALFSLIGGAFCVPFLILTEFYLQARTGYDAAILPFWLNCIFSVMACLLLAYASLDHSYRKKAKHEFLYMMAHTLGLRYRRGGIFALGDLYDHHILPPYAQSQSEEGFAGRVGDFELEFQDFSIVPVRRFFRFDYRASRMKFYGVAIRIKLNRHFSAHTVLIPSFLANGALKTLLHEKFTNHENINLVYGKFKKCYTVLSTDQVESRFIFDPAVIERIIAMGEALGAGWLEISFKDDEMVIIAGQTENFFEIGHLLNPVDVLTIEKALLQMAQIRAAVEILELNPLAGLGGGLRRLQSAEI
jgi:hypothetical protein